MALADDLSVNDGQTVRIVAIAAAMLIQEGARVDAAQSIVGDTLLCQRIGRAAAADKHALWIQNLDHIANITVAGDVLQDNAVTVLIHITIFVKCIFIAARRSNDLFRLNGHKAGIKNRLRLFIPKSLQLVHLILSQKDVGDPAEAPRLKHRISKGLGKIRRGPF